MFIYTVYDRKAQYCLPVFNAKTDVDATRQFTSLVVTSDTDLSKYPADFDLLAIADFDVGSGKVRPIEPYRIVINGLVALTTSNAERSRYKKILDGQLDIEDFIATGDGS